MNNKNVLIIMLIYYYHYDNDYDDDACKDYPELNNECLITMILIAMVETLVHKAFIFCLFFIKIYLSIINTLYGEMKCNIEIERNLEINIF